MRDIKFRGKIISPLVVLNEQWCVGFLSKKDFETFITTEGIYSTTFKIDPDTVGEFTGLYDKNNREIYEGDIIKIPYAGICEIQYRAKDSYSGFIAVYDTGVYEYWSGEIIGNVFENPELLREEL